MNADLKIVGALAPSVLCVLYNGDRALWTKGRARGKGGGPRNCVVCGEPIVSGEEVFIPLGNQVYRSKRFHASHVRYAKEAEQQIATLTETGAGPKPVEHEP